LFLLIIFGFFIPAKKEKVVKAGKAIEEEADHPEFIAASVELATTESLKSFIPAEKGTQQAAKCLKKLGVSGWNPPTPARKLKGKRIT
jgi:hypothetical protein